MRAPRSVGIHLGLLAASVAAAVFVWTRDKQASGAGALAAGDVVVWSGHAADVEKITYETKTRKVLVEAKKDAEGRYFTGTIERDGTPAIPLDGGAAPPPTKTTVGFVSVGPAEKLTEALGQLKALRALGKVGADRAAEFGLAEPEGTVTVRVGGADHQLLLGAATPGGGDRYVKEPASGEVYALKGEPLRNLESADSMLLEHELHEWKDADVVRARVEAGGKSREIVRGGLEGKRFWAGAESPDSNDETLGNWMSKLDRLRPTEFSLTDPEGKEAVLRIAYMGKKALGWIEVVKAKGDKPTFYVRTERTRLFGKVASATAEQVEADIGAIVK